MVLGSSQIQTIQNECWEERLQSLPLLLAESPWLTSADCPGSPLLRSSGHSAVVKMLLSVPPRTGINPYNGYTGKNNNKKVNNSGHNPLLVLPPSLCGLKCWSHFSMRCRFELSRVSSEKLLGCLSCSVLESGSQPTLKLLLPAVATFALGFLGCWCDTVTN